MNEEDISQWCKENASQYLANKNKTLIFRGTHDAILGITNTNEGNRISASNPNYYTLWIDNAPAWKDYPKRTKSLICSTSESTAENYGWLCLVIPADTCKIGICPTLDIWSSFEDIQNLGALTFTIRKILNFFFSESKVTGANRDYNQLVTLLKDIDKSKLEQYAKTLPDQGARTIKDDLIDQIGSGNMFTLLQNLLDPDENGFSKASPAKFSDILDNHEIWIQGTCALIPLSYDISGYLGNYLK